MAGNTNNENSPAYQEKILMGPYNYILQIPGKQIRTKLAKLQLLNKNKTNRVKDLTGKDSFIHGRITPSSHTRSDPVMNVAVLASQILPLAFNHWLQVPTDKLQLIADITQMLHNASLLIDDIEDNSQLRRGIPVTHHIYGVAHTINSGNYVYFLGLEKTLTLGHPEATKVFTEQLLELHRGQGMDIYWRDAYECPTEEEYKAMVIRKTGGLFGLAVRLMQLFSDNKTDFKPVMDTLGLYFQIRDDYANLNSKEYEANKSYCEDLTEGKFSFPIIHGIRSCPDDGQIMNIFDAITETLYKQKSMWCGVIGMPLAVLNGTNIGILRQRTKDAEVKKYCVEHLRKLGSFDYTKQVLFELEEKLLCQIEELGGNPHLTVVIDELKKLYREE